MSAKKKIITGLAGAALLFVGVVIGTSSSGTAASTAAEPTSTKTVSVPGPTVTKTVKVPAETQAPAPAAPAAPAPEDKPASTENSGGSTASQSNAADKAKDYLSISAFSRSGLIEQLVEFEGFSTEDATYGVDATNADWNEQAALKAKEYLDISSFPGSGLIGQLTFDGFTVEQAEYGVSKTDP